MIMNTYWSGSGRTRLELEGLMIFMAVEVRDMADAQKLWEYPKAYG
jgi:hypothetical protein